MQLQKRGNSLHQGAKPMTDHQYKLETALSALNVLILEQGVEFPEAICRVLEAFAVKRSELIEAYDSQLSSR
jgi:hypothetical protein